ncbi:LuxR family transcriptional regulator [Yinghuangia seranimata]|uniref:LuxR family transcriptional regulator n=1 Tax=Yinghuangia seranimata TaxID=408067 RepID=UPI00248A9763|nr:LuxR family transcriptional regulator [Yinghuangia seranimata]MDI2127048.1 AAA family ATPase [Yinghuangia seranimata]
MAVLYGRGSEKAAIDGLLADMRDGRARGLVVRGEAGIGKSALLDHAASAAGPDTCVLRVTGIESEAELAYAALHLLLRPALGGLDELPAVQADALRGAFGLGAAAAADRFMVGLATLGLLAALSPNRPLLCLVDDAQWLDRESADAMLFAVRRLHAEPVAVVFAARDDGRVFGPGLDEVRLPRLPRDAAELLLADADGGLALAVRERIVAEAAGNPLALLEIAGGLTDGQRAGSLPPLAFSLDGATTPAHRVQSAFRDRIAALPDAAKRCLLVAAVDDSGALDPVARAVKELGGSMADFAAAERAGLLRVGPAGVVFRHPLVRSAARYHADIAQRTAAHRALAAVLDGDERAWHLAAVATGPDEEVAAGLERAAARSVMRGGYAAVSAAYERAAELTADPAAKARRLVEAACAAAEAGQLPRTRELAVRASRLTGDPHLLARIAAVRATVEFEVGTLHEAARILIDGAALLEDADPATMVTMLSVAVMHTWYAGARPEQDAYFRRIEELAARAPGGESPALVAFCVGLRTLMGDPAGAVGMMGTAFAEIRGADRSLSALRAGGPAIAMMVGDFVGAHDMAAETVAEFRAAGMAGLLPQALILLSMAQVFLDRPRDAMASAQDGLRIARDVGQPYRVGYLKGLLTWVHAYLGDEKAARAIAEEALAESSDGDRMPIVGWVLHGLVAVDAAVGRYDAVLERFAQAAHEPVRNGMTALIYAAPEHVEAAARTGRPEAAAASLARFTAWAESVGDDWALAVARRCAALVAEPGDAERLFREALALHERSGVQRLAHARTELLFGEWLRRERRRVEAREHLRAAADTFSALGARLWHDRADAELRATGSVPSPRTAAADPLAGLTPQEFQVVKLAATGASNREIGAQLFLSARTVGYHLYKAFPKLGIASRAELARFAG